MTNKCTDREEAKKEDTFDYSAEFEEEEDEEWEQEADWNNEADETEDVKDESAAYLDFLNEEVSSAFLMFKFQADHSRRKSSVRSMMMTMTSWKRKVSSRHRLTRWSHTACSSTHCSVSTVHRATLELMLIVLRSSTGAARALREPYQEPQPRGATSGSGCRSPGRYYRPSPR